MVEWKVPNILEEEVCRRIGLDPAGVAVTRTGAQNPGHLPGGGRGLYRQEHPADYYELRRKGKIPGAWERMTPPQGGDTVP